MGRSLARLLGGGSLVLLGSIAVAVAAACGLSVAGGDQASGDASAAGSSDAPAPPLPQQKDDAASVSVDVDAGSVFTADAGDAEAGTPCRKTALLLADQDPASLNGATSALTGAGFNVTQVADYGSYAGTPSPAGLGVVMLLDGVATPEMPTQGQQAIVAALAQGTGFVTEEWSGWLLERERLQALAPYILFQFSGRYYDRETVTFSSASTHPIWDGLPGSFSTAQRAAIGIDKARTGPVTSIAAATVPGVSVGPAVLVADDGTTRVAGTPFIVNQDGENSLTLDANIRTLFANMALWAAHCR
jgi:hypothetical protein